MQQAQGSAEAEVRKCVQQLMDAIEQLDARRFAACFAEDVDFNTPIGRSLRGRQTILEVHERMYSPHPPPGTPSFAKAKSTMTVVNVFFLRPDVAVVDWEWTQSGAATDGQSWPDRKGMATMVWTRNEGEPWLVSIWRNKDYPNNLPQPAQRS